jgi:hypothetical protein
MMYFSNFIQIVCSPGTSNNSNALKTRAVEWNCSLVSGEISSDGNYLGPTLFQIKIETCKQGLTIELYKPLYYPCLVPLHMTLESILITQLH